MSALISHIRAKVPGVTLRTTFITGFPGETEEQFEELAEFAKEINFQRLGCFAYSQEEGTPAAKMPGQLDDDVKQQRADIIMEHQQQVMADYCESLLDTDIEVLVEGFSKRSQEDMYGRTSQYKTVVFPREGRHIGELVKVEIMEASAATLKGKIAK